MIDSRRLIRYCGWDVGGAHLKFAALSAERQLIAVEQLICPLWQDLAHLTRAVTELQSRYDIASARHAITMTGELCDSFNDRSSGVSQIAHTLASVFEDDSFRLYGLQGSWIAPEELATRTHEIASANWYASAQFVAKNIDAGIIVDLGSTTTDIIPVSGGIVRAQGVDDFSRLRNKELVYTGLVRTPIAALLSALPFEGDEIPVVAETFATAADAYRILGLLPLHADLYPSADGAEKSAPASARRLFRMIGKDYQGEYEQALAMARHVQAAQLALIDDAIVKHLGERRDAQTNVTLIGMGCGEELVSLLAERNRLNYQSFESLVEKFADPGDPYATVVSPNVCGPAVAVAYEFAAAIGQGTSD